MSAVQAVSRWRARLHLQFEKRLSRSCITARQHEGPLIIQKPFYPEGDTCHVYLIHPPGGVVGGDQIELDLHVGAQAHALVTTPGANKFYRSAGPVADVVQRFYIEDGILEWLPQETIFFNHCQVNIQTRVELGEHARFAGWEIQCLGRPASGEVFNRGQVRQQIALWRDGQPLVIERNHIDGESEIMQAAWGLSQHAVMGSFMIYPATEKDLALVHELLQENRTTDMMMSATRLDDVLLIRGLAQQAAPLREQFIRIWTRLRPGLINKEVCIPRIWHT